MRSLQESEARELARVAKEKADAEAALSALHPSLLIALLLALSPLSIHPHSFVPFLPSLSLPFSFSSLFAPHFPSVTAAAMEAEAAAFIAAQEEREKEKERQKEREARIAESAKLVRCAALPCPVFVCLYVCLSI